MVQAKIGRQRSEGAIWQLDLGYLLRVVASPKTVHYTNAKVVLVGDSGVGKSGLGLVLSGQPFTLTSSTHGRYVWNFDRQEVIVDERRWETRETLLWDLAGQPGYRLIHQLHLSEVAVALVVFDAHITMTLGLIFSSGETLIIEVSREHSVLSWSQHPAFHND